MFYSYGKSMQLSEQTSANERLSPSKTLLKRIDIGLTTAVCAVFISLLALVVAKKEIDIAVEAQKASVLPIIDIDFGYVGKRNDSGALKQFFDVNLTNVGAGIAHIQKVTISQKGKTITNYQKFEEAIMTGRMRLWSSLTENVSTGYLRAGESIHPVSYKMGAAESDLTAYLRGEWGVPVDQINVEACYCSVFEDCWTVNYLDRKVPKSVDSCGVGDEIEDVFQDFIDQKAAERLEK